MSPRAGQLAFLLLLVVAACASRSLPPPASPPRAGLDPCARIAALQREALAAACLTPADLEQGGACLPTPSGAWSLVISQLRARGFGSASAKSATCESQSREVFGLAQVIHVPRDGRMSPFALRTGFKDEQGGQNFGIIEANVRMVITFGA